MAPDTQDSEDTLPSKKQFQSDWYEGEQPQALIMRQKCSKYGKDHGNKPCLAGQKVCFKCEKPGHIDKEYPHKYQSSALKPQRPGSVFTLNANKATATPRSGN